MFNGKRVPESRARTGHGFRLRGEPESVSHSERRFRDELSAKGPNRKRRPSLELNSGTQFPPRADPESVSHSEHQFRSAASAPKKKPRLAMESGLKAQLMQLMVSADGP